MKRKDEELSSMQLRRLSKRRKLVAKRQEEKTNNSFSEPVEETEKEEPVQEEEITQKESDRPKTSKKVLVLDIIVLSIIFLGLCAIIGGTIFGYNLIKDRPEFDKKKLISEESTVIYDAYGNEVVELGLYLRENVEYEQLPNCLVDAFVSIEDSRFFKHFGFDIPRFTKAIIENLKSGDFGQGGSTVTMQLVKNSYFQIDANGESTLAAASGMAGVKRKAQEIVLAIEAEKELNKKEIISLYLNKINFGNNIRGVQKAAEYYFGKNVKDINLVEACFLAGIINSPNNFNPYNELYKNNPNYIYLNPNITYLENAQKRTAEVLDLMVYHGYLSKEEAELAKTIKIEDILAGPDQKFRSYSEYYQDYLDAVIDEVVDITGKDPYLYSMKIYTNMDPYMQELVWNIENEKTELKYSNDLEQSALVVLNNQTGELVAIGGGRNQEKEVRQFNRATSAYLQPGSSIKPILEYVLAFDRLGWSTAHTITDQPVFLYGGNVLVSNAGNQGYTGDMLITEAIARSLNTPAVQTLDAVIKEIGEDEVKEYLRSIGITANLDTFDLQWAIGGNTCLVTPVQLAGAHAIFMNEGYYVTPHTVKRIVYDKGDEEYVADIEGNQVVSSAAAYMAATCEEFNVSGSFANLMQILKRKYPVYAKTGTTDWATAGRAYGIPTGAPKDMWMVAQTSNYTVTVWLGFDKAEKGAYFTTSEDMANLKGRICKKLLDELEEHYDYDPKQIERPDDCSEITIVKGAYPYAYSDGVHETVKGLIRTEKLVEKPLVSVDTVYANLPTKPGDGKGLHVAGRYENGVVYVTITTGGYYCSDGTQDLTARNVYGKTKDATGRCYFPHYATVLENGVASAYIKLKVNGSVIQEAQVDGYYEFYGVPSGTIELCNGDNCSIVN